MAREFASPAAGAAKSDRIPPHSEQAEQGVLGSVLLESNRVLDLCLEAHLTPEAFYVPAHRMVYDAMADLHRQAAPIDVLTVAERLKALGGLDTIGGSAFLDRLVDATPTSAHAEFYIDIVRQKSLLRSIIGTAREAESVCHDSEESADEIIGRVEQAFLSIAEHRTGQMALWNDIIKREMVHIEHMLETRRGLTGLATGYRNLDEVMMGLRPSEMIVLAARPSMGKTSLAMNIAENVALGRVADRLARPVGVFSLEMSSEALALRMLCSHAEVSSAGLIKGVSTKADHARLTQAASVLGKAPVYVDDTGGLDVLDLRGRARRMHKRFGVQLIVIDYLQMLHYRDYAKQGRQTETAEISGNLKAMAKELKVPVLVLSQLSRAPEQRDKTGEPKLSDLRDSGAIEQDADVVLLLRRPCKYEADPEHEDRTLAVVDVAKHRNGPTGRIILNFVEDFTRFKDRTHGVDDTFPDGAAEREAAASTEGET